MQNILGSLTGRRMSPSSFQKVHLNYIRNSRAIAVLWCVFTICFAIINIIVFVQPWLGDTLNTKREGYFGLYESCKYVLISSALQNAEPEKLTINSYRLSCEGTWTILSTAVNPVSTLAVGLSALINLVTIATFLVLFLFVRPSIVFSICGVLQLGSTVLMMIGTIWYPFNWGSPKIVDICETSASYDSGKCNIRWAYILAIVGIFDVLLLGTLALILSKRQASNYRVSMSNSGNGGGLGGITGTITGIANNLMPDGIVGLTAIDPSMLPNKFVSNKLMHTIH